MFDERSAFGVRIRALGGITVVEISGELDLLASARLSARLAGVVRGDRPDVVLDLRPVTFLDCAGMSLLCRLRNRVRTHGGRLRLVIADAKLVRLLYLARLGAAFEILEDLTPVLTGSDEPGYDGNSGAIA